MANAIVSGRSETNSFAFIHIGAKHMLKQAEDSTVGRFYNLVACLFFSAFTLEAYFNHFGKIRNPEWDKIEKSLGKLKKIEKFCRETNIKADFEKRPYSTLKELFIFRDTMAHGKTTIDSITKEVIIDPQRPNEFTAGPRWMEYATIDNAIKALVDVESVITELHRAGGYQENPFSILGGGEFELNMTST